MVLISARSSFDCTSGIITDAPSHDERVIAARDEFMDVNDEVSDEDGFLSRSMAIKSAQKDHEGANYDQPCGQRGFVSAFVLRHWRSVAPEACDNSAKEAEFAS